MPAIKPRLLVVSSTYPRWRNDPEPGFVHELARRLTESFEVLVVAPHASGAARNEYLDGVHVQRYRYAPASWEVLVNSGGILGNLRKSPQKWLLVPGFLLAQWWGLQRARRSFRPQVLHAHWLLPQGILALSSAGETPVVVTSHGADLFGLRGRLFAWLRHRVLLHAAAVTVVSQSMSQRVLAEAPDAQVRVMPMGVDVEQRFCPDGSPRRPGRLLFVGRLVEKKGMCHLIDAMPAILARCPYATLDIVGFGLEEASLLRRAAALGLAPHVRFLGALPQHELPAHYREASLFVAPFVEAAGGDQEGLGLVVAEAMACGCPVLVGDIAGVRDLVDGSTGVLISPGDHVALAAAVVSLLGDATRRDSLGRAGREFVQRHFSWTAVASRYAALLSLVATRPAE